ncbi:hypothetical protein [uncultured Brevundimonas sp.]|uniref:hypothetical protein n=1 Tax=uncultured Brevundimonas sp. TaxID=213418 RepID=UPI0026275660|nr:hypothetical protein [uncultured Brevundimonas sp.]
MNIGSIFPSRLTIIATVICLVAVPLAVFSSYGWGLSHRDFVRVDGELKEERAQHAACQLDRAHAQTALRNQSAQIEALAAAGEVAKAEAEARVKEAQTRARAAEREVHRILAEQKREGETACDAAFRLIMETVQ